MTGEEIRTCPFAEVYRDFFYQRSTFDLMRCACIETRSSNEM